MLSDSHGHVPSCFLLCAIFISNSREGRAATQRTRNKSKMEKNKEPPFLFRSSIKALSAPPGELWFLLASSGLEEAKKERVAEPGRCVIRRNRHN